MTDREQTVSDVGELAMVERILSLLGDGGRGVVR